MSVRVITPNDRLEWHAALRQFITASVAGALLRCHPYTTAYQLWAEKTDHIQADDAENAAMRRGRLLEPAAVQMLREERPDWVVDYRNDQAFYCDDEIRIGCTPDAFAMRPDVLGNGIIQFKTSSEDAFRSSWIDPETGEVEIPLWIAVQAIVEAKMTGAKWAAVAVMVVGRGIHMEVVDIPLHDGIWTKLVTAVSEFWRVADSGEHPPIDWDRDGSTVINVNRMSSAKKIDLSNHEFFEIYATKLDTTRAERLALQKREELLRAQILYEMGDAEVAETSKFTVRAPATIDDRGRSQRKITIKLKDQSHGRF
jgi:predicted phage-related endonuclease